jgi:hypothetical protein
MVPVFRSMAVSCDQASRLKLLDVVLINLFERGILRMVRSAAVGVPGDEVGNFVGSD